MALSGGFTQFKIDKVGWNTFHTDDQLMDGIIEVFDIAGRKLLSSSITGGREQYTLNTQGVFLIKITDNESQQLYTEKLISH